MSCEINMICGLEIWAGKQCKYASGRQELGWGRDRKEATLGFAGFLGKYFAVNWHLVPELGIFSIVFIRPQTYYVLSGDDFWAISNFIMLFIPTFITTKHFHRFLFGGSTRWFLGWRSQVSRTTGRRLGENHSSFVDTYTLQSITIYIRFLGIDNYAQILQRKMTREKIETWTKTLTSFFSRECGVDGDMLLQVSSL